MAPQTTDPAEFYQGLAKVLAQRGKTGLILEKGTMHPFMIGDLQGASFQSIFASIAGCKNDQVPLHPTRGFESWISDGGHANLRYYDGALAAGYRVELFTPTSALSVIHWMPSELELSFNFAGTLAERSYRRCLIAPPGDHA